MAPPAQGSDESSVKVQATMASIQAKAAMLGASSLEPPGQTAMAPIQFVKAEGAAAAGQAWQAGPGVALPSDATAAQVAAAKQIAEAAKATQAAHIAAGLAGGQALPPAQTALSMAAIIAAGKNAAPAAKAGGKGDTDKSDKARIKRLEQSQVQMEARVRALEAVSFVNLQSRPDHLAVEFGNAAYEGYMTIVNHVGKISRAAWAPRTV